MGNQLAGAKGICGCWFSINMGQGSSHFVLNAVLIGMCAFIARMPAGPMQGGAGFDPVHDVLEHDAHHLRP
jgi:hypothetical protein